MTLPALVGAAGRVATPVDVVQSYVAHTGWDEMASIDAATPRQMTRDEFASLVTHELRNPLNAMSGWLHLLAPDGPGSRSEATQRVLAGLRRALDQQIAQVDTLGRVLRLAGGERSGARQSIELGGLLDACAETLRPAAQAGGRDVEVVRDGIDASRIDGDAEMLGTALSAIATYGLRHGMPGAALRLALSGEPGSPVLRVSIDEGDDAGLSIWHGFGGGGSRLSLELLHAMLAIESHGARLGPRGDGRIGDLLEIRFSPSDAMAQGDARSPARPHA